MRTLFPSLALPTLALAASAMLASNAEAGQQPWDSDAAPWGSLPSSSLALSSMTRTRPLDPWVALDSLQEPLGGAKSLARPSFASMGDGGAYDDGPDTLTIGSILDVLGAMSNDPADGDPGCELVLDSTPSLHLWDEDVWVGAPWPEIVHNGHTDKAGNWFEYDQIPKRWDRPESYGAYRYPVPTAWVASGYDLDKPDQEQRRGKLLSAVGHGGVDLAEKKETPIRMITLEHQIGDAEVVFVGHLFGTTVVTRHTIREGGKKRDYVLIFGHLDKAADGIWRGQKLRSGELVGLVGDTDSPEFVHLHLEARRMRDGVDAWKVPGWTFNAREVSTVCDPRNVLPLRVPRRAKHKCAPELSPQTRHEWWKPMVLTLGEPSEAVE